MLSDIYPSLLSKRQKVKQILLNWGGNLIVLLVLHLPLSNYLLSNLTGTKVQLLVLVSKKYQTLTLKSLHCTVLYFSNEYVPATQYIVQHTVLYIICDSIPTRGDTLSERKSNFVNVVLSCNVFWIGALF